jgi:hypothetical protein
MTFDRPTRLNAVHPFAVGIVAVCVLAAPTTAAAYVGPGAGLTFIASLLAVGAAVLIMIVGLVAFPIRLMMKAARKKREAAKDGAPGSLEV